MVFKHSKYKYSVPWILFRQYTYYDMYQQLRLPFIKLTKVCSPSSLMPPDVLNLSTFVLTLGSKFSSIFTKRFMVCTVSDKRNIAVNMHVLIQNTSSQQYVSSWLSVVQGYIQHTTSKRLSSCRKIATRLHLNLIMILQNPNARSASDASNWKQQRNRVRLERDVDDEEQESCK